MPQSRAEEAGAGLEKGSVKYRRSWWHKIKETATPGFRFWPWQNIADFCPSS